MLLIKKLNLEGIKQSDIIKSTHPRFQCRLESNDDTESSFYLLNRDGEEIGFFTTKADNTKLSMKIFTINRDLDVEPITKWIKSRYFNSCIEYITIQTISRSEDVLHKFSGLDYLLLYEISDGIGAHQNILSSELTVSNAVENYDELTKFFKKVFVDDEEYCRANWSKLVQNYKELELPKLEIVVNYNGKIVGAIIGLKTPLNKYYLHTIGVDKDFRGKGIGRFLMDNFINKTNGVTTYLNVLASANVARSLYESVGFNNLKTASVYCSFKDF